MKLIAMIRKASVARKILTAMGWDAEKIEAASHARDPSAGLDPPDQASGKNRARIDARPHGRVGFVFTARA